MLARAHSPAHALTRRSEGENATVTIYVTQNMDWFRSATTQDNKTLGACFSPLPLPVCASEGTLRDDVVAFTFDLTNMAFLCCRGTETVLEICPQNAGVDLSRICNGWGLDELALCHLERVAKLMVLDVALIAELVQSPTVADTT